VLSNVVSTIIALFLEYGYFGVFFGVMLENAGLPVPGETILLAAGFGASQGHFSVPIVMLVAAVGAVLGDNAGYAVGRRAGRATLERYGRYVFMTPKRLKVFDAFFAKHGDKTILVARFVTGLRVFAALLAGAAHMPWRRFFVFNLTGAVIWSVAITLVGYFFGHSLELIEKWVGRTGGILLAAIVVGGVVVFMRKRRRDSEARLEALANAARGDAPEVARSARN
jgi:membrane protein DedA with SNARE-associated domain